MESHCSNGYYVKEWVILCQGVISTALKMSDYITFNLRASRLLVESQQLT